MASINLQGDTSGSISISAPSVAGSNTLTLPATTQTLATQNALGVRNLIINGDMRIDQRNAGASVTPTDGLYTVDRWLFRVSQASKLTAQQVTDAPTGFDYSLKVTSSSAYSIGSGDFFECEQRIEGNNVYQLDLGTSDAKTITISFWVKSSLTGTFGGSLANVAFNRSYPFEYTISSANTWEKKTVTVALDTTGTWATDNTIGLRAQFGLGVGNNWAGTAGSWIATGTWSATGATSVVGTSGATWQITGVQLEVGDTATPFEHRPYDMELARCQRYYEKSYDIGTVPGTLTQNGNLTTASSSVTTAQMAGAYFKVRKRAVPTCTAYNSISGASGGCYRYSDGANIGLTFNGVGETAAGRATLASGQANIYLWHFVADAEL